MNDDVVRISPARLCLSDALLLESPEGPRWSPVVGLALEGDLVVATCAGHGDPVRLPAHMSIRVRRSGPVAGEADDESDVEAGMATWYPGDLGAAGSAVVEHASVDGRPRTAAGSEADAAMSHYPGLYGGDLDHVVDALGGAPGDLSPADLRAAAFQRSVAARRGGPAPPEGSDEAVDDDEADAAVDEQMSGLYTGDLGHLVDGRDT
jgi:hypothetical protein